MKKILILLFSSIIAIPFYQSIHASVADSSSYGFTIKQEYTIKDPADSVFKNLVYNIGKWWDSEHTYSHDARNLTIQPFAGGCFCERLKDSGSVRHMTVINIVPGKTLRMEGGLGPLQSMAVNAILTFSISQSCNNAELEVTYTVGGYAPGGLQKMAPIVDRVLGQQMKRMIEYDEK